MEEERNREGWSARQLIKNLKGSSGSRQEAVGNSQPEAPYSVGSRQFEAPTQEEAQSRTRSVRISGSRQEAVGNSQVEGRAASGQANASQGSGRSGGQKTQGKKAKGGVFKGLISGTIISESLILKDIRYTALVASLAIIFIANKFNAEKVERQIIVLEQEARDMRAESLSVSAELGKCKSAE